MTIGSLDMIKDNTVTLIARDRDGMGREIVVPKSKRILLGSVTAPTSAWGETWTWWCDEGECTWIQDPDGTSIEFAALPGESIPFHFLGMKMKIKEGVDIRVSRVEMRGGDR